jgi:hypothetical protein
VLIEKYIAASLFHDTKITESRAKQFIEEDTLNLTVITRNDLWPQRIEIYLNFTEGPEHSARFALN